MTIFLWLAAATADPGTVAEAIQPAPLNAVEDKIVCKSERFVGSHLSQRICKPKSDWETGKKNAKEALRDLKLKVVLKKGGN